MEQKHFYLAFNLIFKSVNIGLGITQKEELYRTLFKDAYLMANDELFDNDSIRRVTSGGATIHRKAVKFLCTETGFESFRINIETLCLPKIANKADFITNLIEYLSTDTIVPDDIKQTLVDGIYSESDYGISRSVAGIMLCLALSQMAKTVRTASPKPQQDENPKYAMRTWLLRLGFIGEEFATARDLLTRRLAGDTAFRNGRA